MMRNLKAALRSAAVAACFMLPGTVLASPTLHGLKLVGATAPSRGVEFDVFLPLQHKDRLEALLTAQQDVKSPQYHRWLTPAQFGAQFGPDKAVLARAVSALRRSGFAVTAQTRSLHVTGNAGQVAAAFGVHLMNAQSAPGTQHIVTTDAIRMPGELASIGARVYSFSPHVRQTFSHSVGKIADNAQPRTAERHGRISSTGPYWWTELKQAYEYPSALATVNVGGTPKPLNGTGATIATLISSDVLDNDIKDGFDHEHWSTVSGTPDPTLFKRVTINGGAPFDLNSGASFEASLDVQELLTGAPGSQVILYNIPDLSDTNIMAGYVTIVEQNEADVVSSSFGICELFYFPQYNDGTDYTDQLLAQHELMEQGNAQGITWLASSGDSAGLQCPAPKYFNGQSTKFKPGVSSPSSDPAVTSVGGTNVVPVHSATVPLDSSYVSENAWADPEYPYDPYGIGVVVKDGYWGAGSGYSSLFNAPAYQSLVNTGSNMRATPDIGMQVGGCPNGLAQTNRAGLCDGGPNPKNGSGNTDRSAAIISFGVGLGGGHYGVIGTSVSSPELASLIAHLVETNGRQGNINPYIYNLALQQAGGGQISFHGNIPGFNGIQDTNLNPGYSLSTGVGTPHGTAFIGQPSAPKAGVAQTPSNP